MPIQLNELLNDLEDENYKISYIKEQLHAAIGSRDMPQILRYYSMLHQMEQHVIELDSQLEEYSQLN